MVIGAFNMYSGISVFHESNVYTQYHTHPAMEIIISHDNTFNVSTENTKLANVKGCLGFPNQRHKLDARSCSLTIYMIESTLLDIDFVSEYLNLNTNELQENAPVKIKRAVTILNQSLPKSDYYIRVLEVIDFYLMLALKTH